MPIFVASDVPGPGQGKVEPEPGPGQGRAGGRRAWGRESENRRIRESEMDNGGRVVLTCVVIWGGDAVRVSVS